MAPNQTKASKKTSSEVSNLVKDHIEEVVQTTSEMESCIGHVNDASVNHVEPTDPTTVQVNDVDVSAEKKAKKTRKVPIEKIIEMIGQGKSDNAVKALHTHMKEDGVKKTRGPSPFNMFVKNKMAEFKESKSDMSTNEKMKECGRLWTEQKGI